MISFSLSAEICLLLGGVPGFGWGIAGLDCGFDVCLVSGFSAPQDVLIYNPFPIYSFPFLHTHIYRLLAFFSVYAYLVYYFYCLHYPQPLG